MILDGDILGVVGQDVAEEFVEKIRKQLKNFDDPHFVSFKTLSICLVKNNPLMKQSTQMPGIYLSLSEGRLLRKVFNMKNKFTEIIDPFE